MYKVYFCSNGPLASRWSLLNLLDNVLGRAIEIGGLDYLTTTFGMYQYFYTGILYPSFFDLLHVEAHMCGTVAFPQNNAVVFNLFISIIRSQGIFRIPNHHVLC